MTENLCTDPPSTDPWYTDDFIDPALYVRPESVRTKRFYAGAWR